MDIYKFDDARMHAPDAKLILKQEGREDITRDVFVNRSILSSVSKFFMKLFYWKFLPEQLAAEVERKGGFSQISDSMKDAIFATREMKVLNVNLFSNLIDSIYAKNVENYILAQKSEDALTLLEICAEYLIEIPYIEILKTYKGNKKGSFDHLCFLLGQLEEFNEENIPWISTWISNEDDLSIIQNEKYANDIKNLIRSKMIITYSDGTIAIYNYKSGILLKMIILDERNIGGASLSNSLGILAVIVKCKTIVFLSVDDLTILGEIKLDRYAYDISFAPNGTILAISFNDALRFFEIERPSDLSYRFLDGMEFNVPSRGTINNIAWKDMICYVATTDGIYELNLDTRHNYMVSYKIFNDPTEQINLHVKINGSMIMVYPKPGGWIKFLSANENYKEVLDPFSFRYFISDAIVSPDGKMLAISHNAEDQIIKKWGTFEIIYKEDFPGYVHSFTPENDAIVVVGKYNLVWYFDGEGILKKTIIIGPKLSGETEVVSIDFIPHHLIF